MNVLDVSVEAHNPNLNSDSPLRILGRILGAAIVDAPALQADLEPVLGNLEDQARGERWHDLRCVTIEAFLSHAHVEGNQKVHIGQITLTAGAILKGRGETASWKPETIGAVVRVLGFTPKRDNKGKAIHLTDQVRRWIHELARDYDVAAVQQGVAVCPLCLEILAAADPAHVTAQDAERFRSLPGDCRCDDFTCATVPSDCAKPVR